MRAVVRLVAVASVLVIAGCNILELDYYREGIGSDLYRAEMPEAARLQDEYIDIICRQANLAPPGITPQERCVLPTFSRDWSLFVQAGMNDIDLRCDRFLNWVDYHRRNDKNITKQIGDTVAAVSTIARVTGSPDRSLDVLGAALGLASNTFANVSARLLVLADQTTIQSVVVVNQNKYRFAIRSAPIDNRPAAIHALRSYLRICMPATIETEINTNTVVAQRGGASGIAAIQHDPLSSTKSIAPPPPPRADRPIVVTPGPKNPAGTPISRIEAKIGRDHAITIQNILCVSNPNGDFGPEGSETRRALIDFKMAFDLPPVGEIQNEGQLGQLEKAIRDVRSCGAQKLGNAFEVGIFTRFDASNIRSRIRRAVDFVNQTQAAQIAVPPELASPVSSAATGDTIRVAVGALRKHYAARKLPIREVGPIDQTLWRQITSDGRLRPPTQ